MRSVEVPVVPKVAEERGRIPSERASELLEFALAQLPAVLWVLDAEMRFQLVVGAAVEMVGLDPVALEGMDAKTFLGDDPAHPTLVAISDTLRDGETREWVEDLMGRHWRARMSPLRDAGGEIVGVVGVSVDDTATIAQEQALHRALDAQRLAERAQDEFLLVATHHLRTPLASIGGLASFLTTDDLEPDLRKEVVARLERNIDELDDMVNRIVTFSELRFGRTLGPAVTSSVDALTATCVASLDGVARRVTTDVQDGLVVRVVPDSFQQVLSNIVANAARLSPADSPITVTAYAAGPDAVVTVADHGPGVPESLRPLVFEAFRQADVAVGQHRGVGVGLAIARLCVEGWGGRIWLEPSTQGAVFAFSIPLVDAASLPPDEGG